MLKPILSSVVIQRRSFKDAILQDDIAAENNFPKHTI
jgi:hypothetical protein